jgi:hypothetical protein
MVLLVLIEQGSNLYVLTIKGNGGFMEVIGTQMAQYCKV